MAKFHKILSAVSTIVVSLLLILALLLGGPRLVGLQVFSVLSGSMEPEYPVGSLLYVKKAEPRELVPGDVITFMLDEDTVATHRIVEVVPDEEDSQVLRFRTKGDANDTEDASLVHYKNVVGSPILAIPGLGYLASYIKSPPGSYTALSVGAAALALVFLPELLGEGEKKEKKGKFEKPKSPNLRQGNRKKKAEKNLGSFHSPSSDGE